MPLSSTENAKNVARRLTAVRASLETWKGALLITAAEHELPAERHVIGVADQADTCAAGAFSEFAQRTATATGVDVESSGLRAAAQDAEAAYADLAAWMRSDLAPKAVDEGGLRRGALPAVVRVLVGGDARPARTVRVGLSGPASDQHADVGDRERTVARREESGRSGRSAGQRPRSSDRRHRRTPHDAQGLHRSHHGRTRRRALRHRRSNSIL